MGAKNPHTFTVMREGLNTKETGGSAQLFIEAKLARDL
jgi:hypothetical protein